MKLLLAIDSSNPSQQMLHEVARLPWPQGTTACVLHVVDRPRLPSGESMMETMRQSADLLVKSGLAKIRRAGLEATSEVLEGHPRIAVSEYARKWGSDLILVGSHGAGGLVRFLLGSVAQATLHRSPCSVEIVRRPVKDSATSSTAMRILIGTDGSECSTAAVKSVAQRPWPSGSQVRVISVIPFVIPVGEMISPTFAPVYPPPDLADALQREAREQAREAVARAQQLLSEARIKAVETEFLPAGDARQVVLDEARSWGADLIVVGSHGYGAIDRLMLGSVSESVAMHADCSVEVIRE